MARDRMDVLELLRKEAHDADIDFLREGHACRGAPGLSEDRLHRLVVLPGENLPRQRQHQVVAVAVSLSSGTPSLSQARWACAIVAATLGTVGG